MTSSFPDKKKKKEKISSLTLIVLAFNCFYQCTQVQATTTTSATATKEENTENSHDKPSLITLAPVVQTAEGKVQGIVQRWDAHSDLSSNDAHNSSSIVYLYQGIPYGRIPGGGRFEAAVPAEKWAGIYQATHYRDACPQLPSARMFGRILRLLSMTNSTSEAECLLLNVWRPVVAVTGDQLETGQKKPLPVMVFIHGGAFETGTIFTQAYDGRYLATVGGVVVVTLQYRLGALGFLTAPGQVPANLGLRDQVLALKWVRRNIAAFGGDPRTVTVFGESAGGSSVAALILSPLASNLFQRAVVQSAAQGGFFSSESVEQGLEKTMRLAARLGCHKQQPKFELGNVKQWLPEVVRCLKERPVEAILAASADAFATNGLFLPVYGADAEVLPVRPEDVLKEESDGGDGNHQRAHHQQLPNPGDLDLMFGITKDEGSMFALALFPELALQNDKNLLTVNSTKALIVRLMQHYGRSAVEGTAVADFYLDRLLKRLPNAQTNQDELKSTIGAVWGDLHLACPTLLFGQRYSLKQAARAKKAVNSQNSQRSRHSRFFAYQLNAPVTVPSLMSSMMPSWIGTFHTTDLFYLFMAPLVRSASLGQSHYRLSLQMMTAWANFARTGAPGRVGSASEQSVQWEEASLADNHSDNGISAMIFETGSSHLQKNLLREVCQGFWKGKIDV